MSREVFLLGFDHTDLHDPQSYNFSVITDLVERGVGQNPYVQPVIISPNELGFLGRMEQIATVISQDNLVRYIRADILENWQPEMVNKIQMAAALAGTIAAALQREASVRSEDEQTIMIVQPQLLAEFLRHNPGGKYSETTQQRPGYFTETNYAIINKAIF